MPASTLVTTNNVSGSHTHSFPLVPPSGAWNSSNSHTPSPLRFRCPFSLAAAYHPRACPQPKPQPLPPALPFPQPLPRWQELHRQLGVDCGGCLRRLGGGGR